MIIRYDTDSNAYSLKKDLHHFIKMSNCIDIYNNDVNNNAPISGFEVMNSDSTKRFILTPIYDQKLRLWATRVVCEHFTGKPVWNIDACMYIQDLSLLETCRTHYMHLMSLKFMQNLESKRTKIYKFMTDFNQIQKK